MFPLLGWMGIIQLLRCLRHKQIVILIVRGVTDDQIEDSWTSLRRRLAQRKLGDYLVSWEKQVVHS